MTGDRVATSLLLALLDARHSPTRCVEAGSPVGCVFPTIRTLVPRWSLPTCAGAPATLTFHADGHEPWRERVDTVVLAALSPGGDERCRWVGIDVDATDHGERGLVDPVHAMRTIAECAAEAGLTAGLLVARSRRGRGRHVFLIPPEPVSLADAVIGVAALAAAAFKVAASDVTEYDARHAFRRANGAIARPGEAGAVELLPRSTVKPPHGWALVLPGAGAFSARGGGVIVDPFEDQPIHHECVPLRLQILVAVRRRSQGDTIETECHGCSSARETTRHLHGPAAPCH